MNYFSQLYLPGALAIWCALLFALTAIWGYSQVLTEDDPDKRRFARRAYQFFALSVVLAAGVLIILLMRRDFRIEYVYQYSGLDLQWFFQFAAFWAGQKGSFLIWLLWGSLLGVPLAYAAKRDEAAVMIVFTLTQLGLLFILVRENPFVMLAQTPTDGSGLNPLLQDYWMVIHPPIMFIGYAATAIPFSFAVAAMWRRRYDRWASATFPWALGGFLVLGTAILMGGYWAYRTLGWGGYWGWDPVENASLIPWLLGVVLIHGLHLERQKQRYRRANLVVACLLYLSVLYGTFLTRSGVLADFSVHSFVDLGISGWLIALMGFFFAMSVWLLATRLGQIPTESNEDPVLSRGTFLVLSTIAVGIATLVIAIGTSAPILTRFMENPGQVGPTFYNRVNQPIAILIAGLLSLVPYLTWRGNSAREIARQIGGASVAALIMAVGLAMGLRITQPLHLLFVFLASLALVTNLVRTVQKGRRGGLRSAGGYLAHVGVGIILIGFLASSAYDESTKVTLEQGVARQVGDLTLTFNRYIPRQGFEKEKMEVEVVRADGSSYLAYPKLFVNQRTRQVMANPHIHRLALKDLYISPIDFDPGQTMGSEQFELTKDQSTTLGDVTLRFVDFDLQAEGNALVQMQEGGLVTIGANVAVERNGNSVELQPLYRFSPNGQVESPVVPLPGGGLLSVLGINASEGAVRLAVSGVATGPNPKPARLSVDVTKKPLINLVWYGLYVVLAGGMLATWQRARELRILDSLRAK
ncbi:MAG: cytochrome c biogenesis protein CcsA [Thermoanaerobaculia bacterium]|nr:cytochrome c biogenesis protein CcsA [Thermoanaerobaculia bacterium]